MSHKLESSLSEAPFLPFSKPTISSAAIEEVLHCLQSGWITTGPRTQQFEEELRRYLDAPYALTISSATAGLYVVLKSLDLSPGDEIITTPMTFVATLNTIVLAGGTPVLVDIDPGTYNLDVTKVEEKITPRTRAILPVHFAGLAVDLDPLYALAEKHQLRIIEDAAHAIGSEYKGKKIGSFGDTQVFSFHPNKNMTTGEGGCITTRHQECAARCQRQRFHGIDRSAWNRFTKAGSQHYDVLEAAHKFNMMDIQAALGLHQLRELDGFIESRTALVKKYYAVLKEWPELILPQLPETYTYRHAWHLFAPLVSPECSLNRDALINALKEQNIGAGLHYQPAHLFTFYRNTFGFKEGDFPHAEFVGNHILSLPLFPLMTEQELDRVFGALASAFGRKWS